MGEGGSKYVQIIVSLGLSVVPKAQESRQPKKASFNSTGSHSHMPRPFFWYIFNRQNSLNRRFGHEGV